MDLEKRLLGALKTLEDLNAPQPDVYRRPDEERLRGKIEGIKLALSYLNEEKLEIVRELTKPLSKHERMMEIAYEYSEADTRFPECGDYPAPCNCDDPEGHDE